ncbi:MAG: MTAP family purine nucleoside phosphorylase [Candidatus Thermoplasmatota archaeon]|nr:MTAP family purine nucleoside phosphorylase [Candidatus Thermoplasmatota archaeon]
MKIGLICGQEINELINDSEEIIVETNYGNTLINFKKLENNDVFFINRHGENKKIPPHNINYRANIQALKSCNIENIISIFTVGSMKKTILTGDFVIPNDFIDFTKSRCLTYFENDRVHIDMNNPFCPSLRKLLIESCKIVDDKKIHNRGVYLTTEGPRLETSSEINLFSNYADIVGMTLVPEIILAREQNMCYAALCVVSNMAAGLQNELKTDEISKTFIDKKPVIINLIKKSIKNMENKKKCKCNKK